jgi:hypothetical protein
MLEQEQENKHAVVNEVSTKPLVLTWKSLSEEEEEEEVFV